MQVNFSAVVKHNIEDDLNTVLMQGLNCLAKLIDG